MDQSSTDHLQIQTVDDGYGPAYHRRYAVDLPVGLAPALRAFDELKGDLNRFSPQILASFEKTKGEPVSLRDGDEFQIHITGPWNGPVRVRSVGRDYFCLTTLDGHVEAGEIWFRVTSDEDGKVRFEIESLARSKDALVDFVYDKIPIAKFAQTTMWCSFCRSFAEFVGDEGTEVAVQTERFDESAGQWHSI